MKVMAHRESFHFRRGHANHVRIRRKAIFHYFYAVQYVPKDIIHYIADAILDVKYFADVQSAFLRTNDASS